MNVHISYKLQRTSDIDREIQHWAEKIQKRLQVFRPELIHLKGLLEQNTPREGITVSLNLRLPSGQMAVHESASAASPAIKAAFAELLSQVGKHKELLRNSHRRRRFRISERNSDGIGSSFQETLAALPPSTATSDDVRFYVNANFRRLGIFVERELLFRESSGEFESGSFSVEEIVDESVARALDEKLEKPDRLGLEPWFYRLAIQAMDDAQRGDPQNGSDVNLQALRHEKNEPGSDEARLQFHQPDETTTSESSIADARVATPEQIAYNDEMVNLVQFALRGASLEDREAFILHGLEGFSADEIAGITDRKPEDVVQSLNRAREWLRHSFPANNPFGKKRLQATSTL